MADNSITQTVASAAADVILVLYIVLQGTPAIGRHILHNGSFWHSVWLESSLRHPRSILSLRSERMKQYVLVLADIGQCVGANLSGLARHSNCYGKTYFHVWFLFDT